MVEAREHDILVSQPEQGANSLCGDGSFSTYRSSKPSGGLPFLCGCGMAPACQTRHSRPTSKGETYEHESKMNPAEAERVVHIVELFGAKCEWQ